VFVVCGLAVVVAGEATDVGVVGYVVAVVAAVV
jgi:hypothetical protein